MSEKKVSKRTLNLQDLDKTLLVFGGTDDERCDDLMHKVFKGNSNRSVIVCKNLNESHFKEKFLQKQIDDVDTVIFACPEWNGSYPWFFKRFIDSMKYKSFKGKTMKMIVWSGGNNKAENLRTSLIQLANFLQMHISFEYIYLETI